jgi:thiosulfate dehydrogenase [quinone] large subunit
MNTRTMKLQSDSAWACLLLRMTLGSNICIHGMSRIHGGVTSFAHSLRPLFQKTPLPSWLVLAFGLILPFLELTLGMLLLLGLRARVLR